MQDASPSRHTTPEAAWLEAAYALLTSAGVEAVKIMPLAKQLGVSRTSFYWHFADREALLEAMIRRWEEKNTGNLIRQTEAYAESVGEAVFNLFDCWLDPALFDARLDLAIRNWARNDDALQARLDAADVARQQAMAAMLERFGFEQADAHTRAMTMFYTQIGYFSMPLRESLEDRVAAMPAYVTVFTGIAPSDREIARFRARHGLTT